jgi:hypothetical protein
MLAVGADGVKEMKEEVDRDAHGDSHKPPTLYWHREA